MQSQILQALLCVGFLMSSGKKTQKQNNTPQHTMHFQHREQALTIDTAGLDCFCCLLDDYANLFQSSRTDSNMSWQQGLFALRVGI